MYIFMNNYKGVDNMKKKEFKETFLDLLKSNVESLEIEEKISLVKGYLFTEEKTLQHDKDNAGRPWTDNELMMVLSYAPTRENCLKLAKVFERGYGSLEQIFRWATYTDEEMKTKGREKDTFIQQVRKVSKKMGWRNS